MNLEEIGAWGGIASPFIVALGLAGQAWIHARRTAGDAARRTEATRGAEARLTDGLEALGKRFDAAIAEFKTSNERNAKHELDCAEFRGATVTALKELASAAQVATQVREKLAVHDERLDQLDSAIEWGTRRIEELFRGQSELTKAAGRTTPAPASEPEPQPMPHRMPKRRPRG